MVAHSASDHNFNHSGQPPVDLSKLDVDKIFNASRAARLQAYHCKEQVKLKHEAVAVCDKAKEMLEQLHPELESLASVIEGKDLSAISISTQFKLNKIYINVDQSISDMNASKSLGNDR